MKEAILRKLDESGENPTFADLSEIEGFSGDHWFGAAGKNYFFWFSCSQDAIDAIDQLANEKRIEIVVASPFAYPEEKRVRGFPLAKKDMRYEEPHWMPVVIRKRS